MEYRKVVFIDPGTKMGWAKAERTIGTPETSMGPRLSSGAMGLPTEPGPRVQAFWANLRGIVGVYTSTDHFVAWEEGAFSRHHVASRMYGMWEGLLLLFCEQNKIPYMAVNQSTIKAYARKEGFITKEIILNGRPVKVTGKGLKPRPRPEWKLSSPEKLQEHEIDSRWGLEYILHKMGVR